jgi:hypothetical protein
MLVDGFEVLSTKDAQSSHVRVSAAHVVVIVLHNSAKETLEAFVNDVVGLLTFVMLIYCFRKRVSSSVAHQYFGLRSS